MNLLSVYLMPNSIQNIFVRLIKKYKPTVTLGLYHIFSKNADGGT